MAVRRGHTHLWVGFSLLIRVFFLRLMYERDWYFEQCLQGF